MRAALALFALAGLSASFQSPTTSPKEAASSARVPALQKIAVIGASLSAGFHLDGSMEMFKPSKIQLAHVIEASLVGEHQPIDNRATQAFFIDPARKSTVALGHLAQSKPSAIVAIDYLFWFGYGEVPEDARIGRLSQALLALEPFTCPILLGDLPDMSAATRVQQPMLQATMVPKPETLVALNARIAEWAKDKKNVVIVPLADITTRLASDQEIVVHGNKWPKGSIARLMQADRLHPTLEGTCAVWVVAVDAWTKAQKDVPASAFELDVAQIVMKIKGEKPAAAPAAPADKDAKGAVKVPASGNAPK